MTSKFSIEILKEVPALPGVYLFNDIRGKLLYVGKAVNLKNRVRSYLQANLPSQRIRKMVSLIHRLEYIVTETEVEALLLENSFIKNGKPAYNILLRDDKTYPYIKITGETFPRAILVRKKTGGGMTFGPFPSTRAARETIKQLHQYFKIRNCDYDLSKKEYEPCLQYHLKRCDAPCNNSVTPEEYDLGVQRARLFLRGEADELIDLLNQEMARASKQLAFERAAHFRDLLGLVTKVRHHQNITKLPEQKLDVLGYHVGVQKVSLMILTVRNGMISRSRHFFLDGLAAPGHLQDPLGECAEDLVSHLTHYYMGHADPPHMLVLRQPELFGLFSQALVKAGLQPMVLKQPQKGYKKELLLMAEENARHHLQDQEAESVKRLWQVLSGHMDIKTLPMTIEGFDISNTQGQLSVASMVSFYNGKPSKKNYRKFKIKTVSGPDDFASMREVVFRRYRRLLDEGKPLPDLVLIDGGPGQLSSAYQSLENLGLGHLPLISLAKKEELIFHIHSKQPIALPKTDSALQLLQRIRDESHRFGVTFHRKRRAAAMLHSELEDLPGLGPVRIKKLLHSFGSVKRIKEASQDQLIQVLGDKTGRDTFLKLQGR